MSIINDALKKVGQPITSEPHQPTRNAHAEQRTEGRVEMKPVLKIERRKSTPNWGPFFLVGVLLLITGPIVGPMFLNNPSSKIISASGDSAAAIDLGSAPKGQYAVEEIPFTQQIAQSARLGKAANPLTKFRLSGVVYSEAGSYCLINGKVVKQGEEVGGATIAKITANEVVLNYQGELITLPVEA